MLFRSDGLGTVQAFNTVTIHARVDGELKNVAFVEGQDVHAKDVLAKIDPAPFEAQLAQNAAKKGQDEAQLANARLDLQREEALLKAKIDTQQLYDTQKALVTQLEAAVKADQAAIESAQPTKLHHHHLPHRRPHRHPSGGSGQHRPRQR